MSEVEKCENCGNPYAPSSDELEICRCEDKKEERWMAWWSLQVKGKADFGDF